MSTCDSPLWEHVGRVLTWVNGANGCDDHETAMRLLKLVEETGEVAAAYIGVIGQNPRKGQTCTREDVAGELCDVVVTALVALATITGDAEAAQEVIDQHLARRAPRLAALMQSNGSPREGVSDGTT